MDFIKQRKKKGKKSKKSNVQGQSSGAQGSSDKLITPSIEYYKNVAAQYRKTLDGLSINQEKHQTEEHSPLKHRQISDDKTEQPYMLQHQKELRCSSVQGNSSSQGIKQNEEIRDQMISIQSLQNEFSTNNILKNAKSERLFLDLDQFKVRTKKEFNHEVKCKNEINECFENLNEKIDVLIEKVGGSVNIHRKDFFDRFKGEMYNIHQNYRDLQESTNENLNKMKLKKEILDKQAERDWFKNECNKIDGKCHDKQEELYKFKDKHSEYLQEKKFLEEQILAAKENKINLKSRHNELMDELNELKEQDPETIDRELISKKVDKKGDQQYFDLSVQKYKEYIAHLQKRNEQERHIAVKKQILNEKSEEITYPFEIFFQDSISQVKEEIVERRLKTQLRGMNTSKTAGSIRPGENVKTPENLPDHFEHKTIFNKYDLEIDHVKPCHFTDSDKRKVLENFLQNDEVLFFVYGLLFPQSVMNMQQSQTEEILANDATGN